MEGYDFTSKRKLRLTSKRIIRNDKKLKLYLLNLHWNSKLRNKNYEGVGELFKLWKLKRLNTLRRYSLDNVIDLTFTLK